MFDEITKAFEALEASLKYASFVARETTCECYRLRGWNDLADVIAYQEGREIVRHGMQDIINWTGYKGAY